MKNRYEIDWDAYAAKARETAAEGAVLLRNENNVLPLCGGEKLAVFGRIQFDYYKSGTGSGGMINTRYVVGILDALKEEKIVLDQELEQVYRAWLGGHPFDYGTGWAKEPWSQEEMPLDDGTVKKAAEKNDAALVIIGRTAGEDRDAQAEKGSYYLSETEEKMLAQVCAAFDRVIVALNVGSIIDMKWVEAYKPQAVLYVWQGGMEGGHAAADVLMGRVNPSGKLADTIALSVEDYPSSGNFGGADGNRYAEDIYVGYRYFATFEPARSKVLYPFGFGLSYTSFAMECGMEKNADGCVFRVRVKNTGGVPGKEVAQVYVSAPQGLLGKPSRVLAAFAKTKCLAPGETEELCLEVKKTAFASYDDSGVTGHKSCYVLEAGSYRFYVGADVLSAGLAGSMEVTETEVLAQCTEALAPVESFERLRPAAEAETFVPAWEKVPLRTYDMALRSREEEKTELPYTGDKGYRLADVYDKKIPMETFVMQLRDEDLCCLVRGEGMCSPKVTPGTAAAFGGVTEALKDYGIPCGCCADGPSGIRMDCGTYAFALPNGTCMACSFNEELVEQLYEMEGAELRKNHIDILLGPGMNIHRNPLNGRNFEYFSEDPLLTGKMAAAQIRGMAKYQVTGAMKHFAANNQEYNRRLYNSVVSERALREIYLKGYEIAVKESSPYAIMTTYGGINGIWTAGNYDLLTTILREEWHYDGMVMTDWWAEINDEGQTPVRTNTAAMVRSQNDIYMVTRDSRENANGDNLEECLKNGALTRAELARCAANILGVLLRSPVMDRSLGRLSKEELDAAENMAEETLTDADVEWHSLEEMLELDGKEVDTGKGKSFMCGLRTGQMGFYKLRMKVRVDASELAQVPVSVFVNGKLLGTHTLNGTGKEAVEIEQSLGLFFHLGNYLKLYFAESGMQIEKIIVERLEETLS
ncbi:MAG: glycoside hydrolase family 3 C-terminal domain-containing protein [Blautia sp.]|nr:glycoside hydrolase family 3 C-terminal domain-containing protein [Blautia sp.]MCM1201849.1 glycoside hydrolase family 3 C-terminal domain-containing protein [Bacteroides fragilis]